MCKDSKYNELLRLLDKIKWQAGFVQELIEQGSLFRDILSEMSSLKASSTRAYEKMKALDPSLASFKNCPEDGIQIIEFDIIPKSKNIEGIIALSGLSPDSPSTSDSPIQLKLNIDGFFSAINSEVFLSNGEVKYTPCEKHHMKILVDFKNKSYSVYVKLHDGTNIFLATNYMFRLNSNIPERFEKIDILDSHFDNIVIQNQVFHDIDSSYQHVHEVLPNPEPQTYYVGPQRKFKTLQELANILKPGDVVLVDGDVEYEGGVIFSQYGTKTQNITIRGVRGKNGKRPHLKGGRNTVYLCGRFYVFEGFEISEALYCGIRHQADGITVRDCIIHDCPNGILSHDVNSGNITVEYCEFYRNGEGIHKHQLYIATDENRYPGSVFRLQHCYIHDSTGGNTVKSRCERTELYYNWIENSYYHALDIIGPDPEYNPVDEFLAREDCDIVGNVFISSRFHIARVGGDGTGQSNGRLRFANNTFMFLNSEGNNAIRAMFGIESVEMYNNLFFGIDSEFGVFDEEKVSWTAGSRKVYGSNNWVQTLSVAPREWINTIEGSDPKLVNPKKYNLKPIDGSPVQNAGIIPVGTNPEFPFPDPLEVPLYVPQRNKVEPGNTQLRQNDGAGLSIGAI